MHALDTIDRKILSILQTDGRTTMQELADKVGLQNAEDLAVDRVQGVHWDKLGLSGI